MGQTQGFGCRDDRRRPRLPAPGQDVEDDVGGMDALAEGFGTSGLHGGQAVGQRRAEDIDHLAIAVRDGAELLAHALQ